MIGAFGRAIAECGVGEMQAGLAAGGELYRYLPRRTLRGRSAFEIVGIGNSGVGDRLIPDFWVAGYQVEPSRSSLVHPAVAALKGAGVGKPGWQGEGLEERADDMAGPILNGNVEGSLRWEEQLARPELGSYLSKYLRQWMCTERR